MGLNFWKIPDETDSRGCTWISNSKKFLWAIGISQTFSGIISIWPSFFPYLLPVFFPTTKLSKFSCWSLFGSDRVVIWRPKICNFEIQQQGQTLRVTCVCSIGTFQKFLPLLFIFRIIQTVRMFWSILATHLNDFSFAMPRMNYERYKNDRKNLLPCNDSWICAIRSFRWLTRGYSKCEFWNSWDERVALAALSCDLYLL